jgi:predicted dehydrogenase
MLTIGLVGCGAVVHNMYSKVLRQRPGYKVGYVFDAAPGQAASAARLFDAVSTDLESLVVRSDAIVVTTPPDTHAGLLRQCLRPAKTVLCEKPFTTTAREAGQLASDAESCGAFLAVGHFRRAFPQVQLARSVIASGAIGDITGFAVSEGGRFTWNAVSRYTLESPSGGVLWDTGSHSLDMTLFAAGLDDWQDVAVEATAVQRDKPEPSHDLHARVSIQGGPQQRRVAGSVHVSRKDLLPNLVRLQGERGSVAFVVGPDRYVRLTTERGSVVLTATSDRVDVLECLDAQFQRVFQCRDAAFSARRFVNLTSVLETMARA